MTIDNWANIVIAGSAFLTLVLTVVNLYNVRAIHHATNGMSHRLQEMARQAGEAQGRADQKHENGLTP